MGSISASPPIFLRTNPSTLPSSYFPSFIVFSSSYKSLLHTRFRSLKSGFEGERAQGVDALSPDLLRKPVISHVDVSGGEEPVKAVVSGSSSKNAHVNERFLTEENKEKNEEWVDWEDQILKDTVPLVGFVRMLLHSGKFSSFNGGRIRSRGARRKKKQRHVSLEKTEREFWWEPTDFQSSWLFAPCGSALYHHSAFAAFFFGFTFVLRWISPTPVL